MAPGPRRRGGAEDLGQDEWNEHGKLKFFWDDQLKLREHKQSIEHKLQALKANISQIKARSDAALKANVKKVKRLQKTLGELETALNDCHQRIEYTPVRRDDEAELVLVAPQACANHRHEQDMRRLSRHDRQGDRRLAAACEQTQLAHPSPTTPSSK
eukprot:755145-Hanusia_phi.AAC.6